MSTGAAVLRICSPNAVNGSRFDLIGFQRETHEGNRGPIRWCATSFATQDPRVSTVFIASMLMLPGQPPASRHLIARRHITAAAAPERASRHLEARSYEGCQANRNPSSQRDPAARRGRSTGVAATPTFTITNAGCRTSNANVAVACALSTTHSDIPQVLSQVSSKLLATFVGTICLPIGMPPAFSIFWWISPSFCLSSRYSS